MKPAIDRVLDVTDWCTAFIRRGDVFGAHQLRLFRFAFFAVLAVDMWLQISHAPRYGAGRFNVSHLPVLDGILPTPTRPLMLVLFIAQAYLAARVALGWATRTSVGMLAALFGYTYFCSQLDSYQHHYLIFLSLVVLSFVDWKAERSPDAASEENWPIRLFLIQVSVVYFWAVVTKLSDPLWMEGQTLSMQVHGDWAREFIVSTLGSKSDPLLAWSRFAKLVVFTELFLATVIHIRRARPFVFYIGAAFHLSIEFSGFRIGQFSYFMVAVYLLMLPQHLAVASDNGSRVLRWLVVGASALGVALSAVSKGAAVAGRWLLRLPSVAHKAGAAVLLLSGGLCLTTLPFSEKWALICIVVGLGAVAVGRAWSPDSAPLLSAAVPHVLACIALVGFATHTDAARDYYRFWGGSARRLGNLVEAKEAYTKAVEVAPDYAGGHRRMGALFRTDDPELALKHFRRAQELEPNVAASFTGEARIHSAAGRGEEAVRAADRALVLEPNNNIAKKIIKQWRGEVR